VKYIWQKIHKRSEYGSSKKTAHNRSVYASPPVGGSGFRRARSLRYAPFPRQPPPTFLQPWSLLRKAPIRAAKTSPTAGTLCAMHPKIVKIYEKQSKSNMNLLKNRNLSAIIKTFWKKVLK
jgi:hypothetical protein